MTRARAGFVVTSADTYDRVSWPSSLRTDDPSRFVVGINSGPSPSVYDPAPIAVCNCPEDTPFVYSLFLVAGTSFCRVALILPVFLLSAHRFRLPIFWRAGCVGAFRWTCGSHFSLPTCTLFSLFSPAPVGSWDPLGFSPQAYYAVCPVLLTQSESSSGVD